MAHTKIEAIMCALAGTSLADREFITDVAIRVVPQSPPQRMRRRPLAVLDNDPQA